jgi:hypothetical protein
MSRNVRLIQINAIGFSEAVVSTSVRTEQTISTTQPVRGFLMSDLKAEVISRRKAFSLLGLATLVLTVPATVLTVSDAEAQAQQPAPAAPSTGTERRQERRTSRVRRRTGRRAARRKGRAERGELRRQGGQEKDSNEKK